MSRLFEALRRSESERSGIEYPAVTHEPTEPLQAVELLQAAEAPHSVESKESESPPRPCRSCGSPLPADKLFCPKCDSFQGAVAVSECDDDEPQPDAGPLAFPDPQASRIRALWLQRWAKMPRWMAIALPAGLTVLTVLALTVHREVSVQPFAAAVLPDVSVGSGAEVALQAPVNMDVRGELRTEAKTEAHQTNSAIARVDRVEVVPADKGVSVQISASRPIKPRITELKDPPRVVIDLPNGRLTTDQIRIPVESQDVTEVRATQYRVTPPLTRVVVELTAPPGYLVLTQGNNLVIWFESPDTIARRKQ